MYNIQLYSFYKKIKGKNTFLGKQFGYMNYIQSNNL